MKVVGWMAAIFVVAWATDVLAQHGGWGRAAVGMDMAGVMAYLLIRGDR